MAINKYEFTDAYPDCYHYLKDFLEATGYFSSVVFRTVSPSAGSRISVEAYVTGATRPILVFDYLKYTDSRVYPMLHFNGKDMGGFDYCQLVNDPVDPDDWPTGSTDEASYPEEYVYCSYDELTDTYTPVSDSTEYEPGVYYRCCYFPWYTDISNGIWIFSNPMLELMVPKTGYMTSKGFMLITRCGLAIIFAKTNNDKFVLITPDASNYDRAYNAFGYFASYYAVAADADTVKPANATQLTFSAPVPYNATSKPTSEQTTLCQITTHRTDVASYASGVYCMPMSQHRTEGIITIGGTEYVTNGYFALQD